MAGERRLRNVALHVTRRPMNGRGWRSRIERVSPERVTIAVSGELWIRVHGFALGWLRCNGALRYVWGRFNEAFKVNATSSVTLLVRGLTGSARQHVNLQDKHLLHEPLAARPSAALRPPQARRTRPQISGCSCRPQGIAMRIKMPPELLTRDFSRSPLLDPKTDD
jgi:hypothetical protein